MLGDVFRVTEGYRNEMAKTKPGENQLPGQVLVWDATNRYYKLPANNDTGANSVVVVNTETNVDHGAANVNIDGIREVLMMGAEVCVKTTTNVNVGDEVKYSATAPGTVDKYVPGTDTDGNKIVGRVVKLESEEVYDVTKSLTNPTAGSNIIMLKYGPSRTVDVS